MHAKKDLKLGIEQLLIVFNDFEDHRYILEEYENTFLYLDTIFEYTRSITDCPATPIN